MSVLPDTADTRPHFVYRCYDAAGRLLYVGCAVDPAQRLSMHMEPSTQSAVSVELQSRMARHASTEYPTKAAARAAEVAAIREEAPLLNRQHNPKRWTKAGGRRWRPVAPSTA